MIKTELKRAIIQAVASQIELSQYRLFLFGSFAREQDNRASDIDVGIEGTKPLTPRVIFQITDELDKIQTLKRFDLVDFKAVTPEFYLQAKQDVLYLN